MEDGEWEAPQIPNPKCKDVGCGKWQAPLKNNPDYKGKWTAPLVTNPDYKVFIILFFNMVIVYCVILILLIFIEFILESLYLDLQGVWAAKKIPNPNYFEDLNPFAMKTIVKTFSNLLICM